MHKVIIDNLDIIVDGVAYDLETNDTELYKIFKQPLLVYSMLDASIIAMVLDDVDLEEIQEIVDKTKANRMRHTEQDDINELHGNDTHKFSGLYAPWGIKIPNHIYVAQSLLGFAVDYAEYVKRTGGTAPAITLLDKYEVLNSISLDDSFLAIYEVLGESSKSKTLSTVANDYFVKHSTGKQLGNKGFPLASSKYAVSDESQVVNGNRYSTKMGGIRFNAPAQTVRITEDNILIEIDISSCYPSLLAQDGYIVDGIVSKEHIIELLRLRKESDGVVALAYKKAVNTLTGSLASKSSKLYAPQTRLNVIKGAQVRMLELIERLNAPDILKVNTDGILLTVNKTDVPEFLAQVNAWQDDTGLQLTIDQFDTLMMEHVTSYWVRKIDGTYKRRGKYAERDLEHRGLNNNIFNAITRRLYDGVRKHGLDNSSDVETLKSIYIR